MANLCLSDGVYQIDNAVVVLRREQMQTLRRIQCIKQPNPAAENNRDHVDVVTVDQPEPDALVDDTRSAADPNIPAGLRFEPANQRINRLRGKRYTFLILPRAVCEHIC